MSRQRLFLIAVPALVVGAIEVVSDTIFDPVLAFPLDALLMTAVVVLLAAALSGVAYRRIDALGAALAIRNRELQERAASAAALRRVSVAITALGDVHEILAAIVRNARTLLGTDAAILLLADGDARLRLAAADAVDAVQGRLDTTGELAAADGDDLGRFLPPELAATRLVAPLQRGRQTVGLLAVASRARRAFDVDDLETLASLADQAAIAIEQARLQDQLRDLAVETERERIAREMHDGLAQVLGYVNTKSQAVEQLLSAGRLDEAREHMAELGAAARSVYVDVREAILGLRSPITPGLGLVGAIADYAKRFSDASKIQVSVTATAAGRAVQLDGGVEAHVFRIVQESLTNVRKHSGASRVTIGLDRAGDALEVRLSDDGRGFVGVPDTDADWPRYGLAAMRERAEAIGATLRLSTGSAGGGVVTLAVPIRRAAGVA